MCKMLTDGLSRYRSMSPPSRIGKPALRTAAVVLQWMVLGIPGHVAPTYSLGPKSVAETLTGKPVDPIASSAGRVVVLLFVRTDCPISNRYAPRVQHLAEQYRGKVNFWLVYPDPAESPTRIRTHLDEFHYNIPALRDTRHELVKLAQATITPEAAVFNSSGALVYHGRIDNWYQDFGRSRLAPTTHELNDAVVAALGGKPMS